MVGGEMDRRVVFESKVEVVATNGQRTNTWSTFITLWGGFVQKDGSERTDDNNRTTSRMITFKTRWDSTITNEMRIKFEDEWYKIEDIKEIKRHQGLLIMTTLQSNT